jgi:hypothetical protein
LAIAAEERADGRVRCSKKTAAERKAALGKKVAALQA